MFVQNTSSVPQPILDLFQQDSLHAIDMEIQELRRDQLHQSKKSRKDLTLQCLLVMAEYKLEDDEKINDVALEMLDEASRLPQCRSLAIAVLRLLPTSGMDWMQNNPYRAKFVALLDSQFANEWYKDKKVDVNAQAHEKLTQLTKIAKETEQNLEAALKSLTSIERAQSQRQKLMAVINGRVGKSIVRPFLPVQIDSLLADLFGRVETYLRERSGSDVVDAKEKLEIEIDEFVSETMGFGTLYSQWFADYVGNRLSKLVKEDFAGNKAAQPSRIAIGERDKKYPLHLENQSINLSFIVRNEGSGYAYEAKLIVACEEDLELTIGDIEIGRMAPGTSQIVRIPAVVKRTNTQANLLVEVKWRNFSETCSILRDLTLHGQRTDIDWSLWTQADPYSLEPVSTDQELVGRKDVLNRLLATIKGQSVGSSIIQGQKRVGKTSIAKAIQSRIQQDGYVTVYLESGDYVEPNPQKTIRNLGEKLSARIRGADKRLAHLQIPAFDESFSPFASFLDEVINVMPDRRILLILDEFDELPLELYARGAVGNAFFLSLRSISSRQSVGFLAVGGEKMAHVLDAQGQHLNKWVSVSVDYFTRETDWSDYCELVQRPVAGVLEYTDDSMRHLHELTAGNPFFTKLICQYVFRNALERRDCYITSTEVDQGVEATILEAKQNTFQHFWEDGIFEAGERATNKSIQRRKVLIAVSDVLSRTSPAPKSEVTIQPLARDVESIDSQLQEFVARKILLNPTAATFNFKVHLFQKWLVGQGVHEMIAGFADIDSLLSEREKQEKIKVQSGEIVELVQSWGVYKGQVLTEDNVRVWLSHFNGIEEQRLMFELLKHLKFYSDGFVRKKMLELHDIVRRGLGRYIERGQLKRSDILVSYLDGAAKSGAHYARLYADEAKIYVENMVEKSKLPQTLQQRLDVKALVFIDDFVGTGESLSEYLLEQADLLKSEISKRKLRVVVAAIVAFKDGWQKVEQTVERLSLPIETHYFEMLDETAKCFSETSQVFSDPQQRESARKIALQWGKQLEKSIPLGYGGLELLVAFERGCPNNSLPILWSESSNPKWVPLFRRN